MNLVRHMALLVVTIAAVSLAAACGGDDDESTPEGTGSPAASPTPNEQASGDYSGVVITTDVTTGPNRFAVGVLDENGVVLSAEVSLAFIKLTSQNEGQVRFESETDYVELERFYIDDDTGEKVTTGATGAYVTQADFDETGDWGVQITGSKGGDQIGPINLAFQVVAPEETLNVGDPAPKSRQTLASDVADITEIDSMSPPDPMHDLAIADAVTSGKPTVILFGTPAFCETQVCGPVLEAVMLPLYDQYKDQANFIHVEPYFLETLRSGAGLCAVPAFNIDLARSGVGEGAGPCPTLTEEELQAAGDSWNLNTEPIIFVVDSEGNIAGKFEAVVGPGEVEEALVNALPSGRHLESVDASPLRRHDYRLPPPTPVTTRFRAHGSASQRNHVERASVHRSRYAPRCESVDRLPRSASSLHRR